MREDIVSLTPSLRRYAHALLGRWPNSAPLRFDHPAAPDFGRNDIARRARGLRADIDADDLVHEALLGFWRAGLIRLRADGAKPSRLPEGAVWRGLLRSVTALAREALAAREAREIWATRPEDVSATVALETRQAGARHFPWSPEARALPRLRFESRALIALSALERLDYEAIGEILDMGADRALTKLACARAQFAGEIAGESRPFLHPASSVADADLHAFADDLLDPVRRAKVASLLKSDPVSARRVAEWRRCAERLRGAFANLDAEPLPARLDFQPPVARVRRAKSGAWARLGAWLSGSSRPMATAQ